MVRWMPEVPVPLAFTLPSSFRIRCSLSFEVRGRMSSGESELEESSRINLRQPNVSSGMFSWEGSRLWTSPWKA